MMRIRGRDRSPVAAPTTGRGPGGQAMVEFAVILPVLLVIGMSVFDYGYYLEHVNNIATVSGTAPATPACTRTPATTPSGAAPAPIRPSWPRAAGAAPAWRTTVSATQPTQAIDPSSGTYTIQVASISGFSTYDDGFTVATTTSTGVAALINCSGTATVSGQAEFTGVQRDRPRHRGRQPGRERTLDRPVRLHRGRDPGGGGEPHRPRGRPAHRQHRLLLVGELVRGQWMPQRRDHPTGSVGGVDGHPPDRLAGEWDGGAGTGELRDHLLLDQQRSVVLDREPQPLRVVVRRRQQ